MFPADPPPFDPSDQLSKLLTVVLREERFCEGLLASQFENGLPVRFLRRLAALVAESSGVGSAPGLDGAVRSRPQKK